jgi:hypothetical protein
MKGFLLVALAMLGPIPALAQDQASCKAFFQVLRADRGSPGLRTGLDTAQKRWWNSKGQKDYPGLCLNGSVTSGDRPRYLVIWSKSKTIGSASLPPNEVYGQTTSALQATAPTDRIYQPRWDLASVTIVNVLYDGKLMLPPVYFETAQHAWVLWPDSPKVLEGALKYLSQERVFLSQPDSEIECCGVFRVISIGTATSLHDRVRRNGVAANEDRRGSEGEFFKVELAESTLDLAQQDLKASKTPRTSAERSTGQTESAGATT